MALLGMGADPGTTNVYAAYAAKHLLDEVTELRVRDGDNSVCQGHDGFVAAFSPWVFIDECLCKAVSFRDGRYHLEAPLTRLRAVRFPRAGRAQLLLRRPRGVEDAAALLPRRAHRGLQALHGRRDGRDAPGHEATGPLRQAPRPGGRHVGGAAGPGGLAAARPQGPGRADARQDLRRDAGAGGSRTASRGRSTSTTSPTTRRSTPSWACRPRRTRPGSRPVIAARLINDGRWAGPGVRSPEEFDPDPFLERLAREGMPWHVRDDSARSELPRVRAIGRSRDRSRLRRSPAEFTESTENTESTAVLFSVRPPCPLCLCVARDDSFLVD